MSLRLKRVNWSLLACHFLAIPFLLLGAQQLQLIRWAPLMRTYQKQGVEGVLQQQSDKAKFIAELWMGPGYALILAVLVGCIFSAIVVRYRRESWLIPLFLLVLGITSSWTRYYESKPVSYGLALLRWPFENYSIEVRFAVVGSILVASGLLPFLLTGGKPRLKLQGQQ